MAAQTADRTAGLDASGGVLAEIEAKLRAPDSILEPGVLDLLKEYLRAGGRPQSAIEDLSENYAGTLLHRAAQIRRKQRAVELCLYVSRVVSE